MPFILVNVDRVYHIMPIKRLRKKTELPKDTQEVICPLMIERQEKTPVIDRWYKKQDKKGKTRSSKYSSTKIWRKKWSPEISAVS